jgi:hypothetical protein
MKILQKCLQDAKMDKSSIHDVVLVGGSGNSLEGRNSAGASTLMKSSRMVLPSMPPFSVAKLTMGGWWMCFYARSCLFHLG